MAFDMNEYERKSSLLEFEIMQQPDWNERSHLIGTFLSHDWDVSEDDGFAQHMVNSDKIRYKTLLDLFSSSSHYGKTSEAPQSFIYLIESLNDNILPQFKRGDIDKDAALKRISDLMVSVETLLVHDLDHSAVFHGTNFDDVISKITNFIQAVTASRKVFAGYVAFNKSRMFAPQHLEDRVDALKVSLDNRALEDYAESLNKLNDHEKSYFAHYLFLSSLFQEVAQNARNIVLEDTGNNFLKKSLFSLDTHPLYITLVLNFSNVLMALRQQLDAPRPQTYKDSEKAVNTNDLLKNIFSKKV